MSKRRIGMGVVLGVVTALVCLVLTDSLLETGKGLVWRPEIEKAKEALTSFLRPALLGFFASLFLSNCLVQVERSARFAMLVSYLAILTLVLIIPAIVVFCDMTVWVVRCWYGAGLIVSASLMWNVILKRRGGARKMATP
jgi:hypothetical protein